MMNLKVTKSKPNIEEDAGILYIVCFDLDDKQLVKIGVTSRNIEDRVSEILVSIFKKYREFPYCRPKRFRRTGNVYEKEAILHEHFKDSNYTPLHKFGGSTEFFDAPLDEIVSAYEQLLNGETLESRQVQSNGSE